eukprot:2769-Heterococcus_DN1.PRE.1
MKYKQSIVRSNRSKYAHNKGTNSSISCCRNNADSTITVYSSSASTSGSSAAGATVGSGVTSSGSNDPGSSVDC